MSRFRPHARRAGVAALEFALAAPFLMALLASLSDFQRAYRTQISLAQGVSAAAAYDMKDTGAATPTVLKTIIQSSSGLTGVTVSSPSASPYTFCSCPSGSPVKATSVTCGSKCSDGTSAGTWVTITATYTYTPLMPGYGLVSSPTLSSTITERVQ